MFFCSALALPLAFQLRIAYEKAYPEEKRDAAERYDISQVLTLVILECQNVEKVFPTLKAITTKTHAYNTSEIIISRRNP